MGAAGAIGAVFALISLISTIGYLAHSWKVQIETNYAFKLEAELAKVAKEYQELTAKQTAGHADEMDNKNMTALEAKHQTDMTIRELTYNFERMAHEQPFKASNLYEYHVKLSMCLISQGNDQGGREACNRFQINAENYSPQVASFITVTRETTDHWNEQCDSGVKTFCNYSIMGLTERGASDLLTDLNTIDYYQLRLNYGEDARIKALKDLRDMK